MLVEFADVVEQRGDLPNQQLGVLRERKSLVVALVVGFIEVGSMQMRGKVRHFSANAIPQIGLTGLFDDSGPSLVKPRFLDRHSPIVRRKPLSGVGLHNNPHTVVWHLPCLWGNSDRSVFTPQLFFLHLGMPNLAQMSQLVVKRNTSLWLVYIYHGKAYKIRPLGVDTVAVEWSGSVCDTGSFGIVSIILIGVWSGGSKNN